MESFSLFLGFDYVVSQIEASNTF